MKKLMAVLMAIILMAGFTCIFGVGDAYAKRVTILGNMSKAVAPIGPYGELNFIGEPGFGGELRINVWKFLDIGFGYTNQKMNGEQVRVSPIAGNTGQDFIDHGYDPAFLGQYGIISNTLLTYTDRAEYARFNNITAGIYFVNHSSPYFEPFVGLVAGGSMMKLYDDYTAYYHPHLDDILGYHWQIAEDDGSGGSRRLYKESTSFIGGIAIGTKARFSQKVPFVLVPEIVAWLKGNEKRFTARIGAGVEF